MEAERDVILKCIAMYHASITLYIDWKALPKVVYTLAVYLHIYTKIYTPLFIKGQTYQK